MGRNVVCFSYLINKPLQHVLNYETTTNTDKNKKFSRKVPEESVESKKNHELYSENFIYDPLNVFSKPLGTISFRIM